MVAWKHLLKHTYSGLRINRSAVIIVPPRGPTQNTARRAVFSHHHPRPAYGTPCRIPLSPRPEYGRPRDQIGHAVRDRVTNVNIWPLSPLTCGNGIVIILRFSQNTSPQVRGKLAIYTNLTTWSSRNLKAMTIERFEPPEVCNRR